MNQENLAQSTSKLERFWLSHTIFLPCTLVFKIFPKNALFRRQIIELGFKIEAFFKAIFILTIIEVKSILCLIVSPRSPGLATRIL